MTTAVSRASEENGFLLSDQFQYSHPECVDIRLCCRFLVISNHLLPIAKIHGPMLRETASPGKLIQAPANVDIRVLGMK